MFPQLCSWETGDLMKVCETQRDTTGRVLFPDVDYSNKKLHVILRRGRNEWGRASDKGGWHGEHPALGKTTLWGD